MRGTLPPPFGRLAVFAAFQQTVSLKSPRRSFTAPLTVVSWRKCSILRDPGKAVVPNSLSFRRKGRAWLLPGSWDSGKLHGVMAPKLGVPALRSP